MAILREFRWTLLLLLAAIALGALLYHLTPQDDLAGRRPGWDTSVYAAWMAMLAQPLFSPPATSYLIVLCALYPVVGAILIGEGIVRLALLLVSRRQGEKEWMRVMASTYSDHIILCGIGHLGFRVLEQLVACQAEVVCIEKDPTNRFLAQAKALGRPILLRDMKEDQALLDAGVERAVAIIIATNDDMANLEVALDARRMNPHIRIILRLFDQQVAAKISGALTLDAAFSSSALAAPIVAAMGLQTRILSTHVIGDVPHVSAEQLVADHSPLVGHRVADLEVGYSMRILALTPRDGALQSPPTPGTLIRPGDTLVVHTMTTHLPTLAAAARG